MKAQQYLDQIRVLEQRIDGDILELERLNRLVQYAAQAEVFKKLWEVQTEINQEIDRFVEVKQKILDQINKVKRPEEQQLLRLRYVEHKTWEVIAEEMNYSVRQVYNIHSAALKQIQSRLH